MSILGAGLVVLIALTGAASAQQSSSWPQFQKDGAHSGSGTGPEPPYREAWHFDVERVEQRGASAPVIAGDVVIVVGPKSVYGIDLATGAPEWGVPRAEGSPVSGAVVHGDRDLFVYTEGGGLEDPEATPTPEATGSDDRERSTVVAIDIETQEEVWSTDAVLEGVAEAPPVAHGDTLIVGDDTGVLAALDAATGKPVWNEPVDVGGEVLRSPAVANGKVVLSFQQADEVQPTVAAYDLATGAVLWSVAPPVTAPNPFTTVPTIADGAVFFGAFDRVVHALSLADGAQRWSTSAGFRSFGLLTSPAAADGAVYLGDDTGGLHRLDTNTGQVEWSYALNSGIRFSAPVVSGQAVVVGLIDGRLAAIDRDTGLLAWESDAGDELGPIALSEDLLVVTRAAEGSGVVAFEHDPDASLSAIVSPSELQGSALVLGWLGAAAIVALVLFVPLRLVASRIAPSPVADDASRGSAEDGTSDDEGDADE
ncbi:MAG: PQQ-binding-like beta-propeller repeat protein [Actinomycetota bacterium]